MSFYTTEEQITELFGKCGDLKRVVMGLDKVKRVSFQGSTDSDVFIRSQIRSYFLGPRQKCQVLLFQTPCGFCFVEYYTRDSAANAMRWINGTRLDDRIIRSDWDCGFIGKKSLTAGPYMVRPFMIAIIFMIGTEYACNDSKHRDLKRMQSITLV